MRRLTTDEFIERAKAVHGDRYDYSMVDYQGNRKKIEILCKYHNKTFLQEPSNHLMGKGCTDCGNISVGIKKSSNTEKFIEDSIRIHGNKYDYSHVQYKGKKTNVKIFCNTHKTFFLQTPDTHKKGSGCPACGKVIGKIKKTAKITDVLAKFKETHGDKYDYSRVDYVRRDKKVKIICKTCGTTFEQVPAAHIQGNGCPVCAQIVRTASQTHDREKFIEKATEVHGNKYDYCAVNYTGCKSKVSIICKTHGEYRQVAAGHLQGDGCPKCACVESKGEQELADFLAEFENVETRNRKILKGRELDIYLPDKQIAIEYNGSYFHSEKRHKDPKWHMLKKQQDCEAQGIRLIHVGEYEDKTVVKRTLSHILGIDPESYYARKCTLSIHSSQEPEIIDFFNRNHLQGTVSGCWVGCLRIRGQIVCAMAFSKAASERGNRDSSRWELRRFASVCRVVGGASRLLKLFIRNHLHCSSIISYSENRWFTGGMYEKLGFTLVKTSGPDYKYHKRGKVEPKGRFKRSCLSTRQDIDFKPEESESENCKRNGWYKLWDCGKRKWELKIDHGA